MSNIAVRSTVCGLMVEATEGTPLAPTGATKYIKLQPGFSMSPAFSSLNSEELSGTIGASKAIQGSENPTASLTHYLRGSGASATAPAYGELVKAALGASDTESTEYDTVSGSTTTVLELDTGEGATIRRGQAALVKHATSAWELRPYESVAGDSATLGFALDNAPASGVNLGKATTYYPANTGHQSLCLWYYLGNEGAKQVMAGSRVTSISIDATAGALLTANYSLEGIWFGLNPIEITSSDVYIDFTEDGPTTYAAAISAGWYKTPQAVASALQTAMNATATAQTYTVTYSNTTGKFSIVGTGTLLSILWNTGANAANTIGDKIGFSVAADDTGTGATTGYTSDNAQTYAAPHTPTYDSAEPLTVKNMEVYIGDSVDTTCLEINKFSATINTPKATKGDICAESGIGGSSINSREVMISFSAYLSKYDTDKFNRFATNDDTAFMFAFGEKSGGNWVETKCGTLYAPKTTITKWNVVEVDGIFAVDGELKAYDDGNGDIFLSTI